MTKYMSDQNRTCFQYESGNYALLSGNRQWIGLVQEHSLEPNINVIPIRYQGSTDRNVDAQADGMKEWTGNLTYYPQDWKMLGFAIGSISDVNTGSHSITESNSDDNVQPASASGYPGGLTTFTLEDSKNTGTAGSNFIRTTIGTMIDSYTINATQGEVISCEMTYRAQNSTLTSGAIVALAATTTAPFMFNDVKLSIPSGTDTLIDNVKDLTFSVNNNLEPGNYLNGSRVLSEILPMNRDYELAATTDMDTATAGSFYERYYLGGSKFNTSLMIWGTAGSVSIYMSGCKMTDMPIPSTLEGVQEMSFTAVPEHVNVDAYDTIAKYIW